MASAGLQQFAGKGLDGYDACRKWLLTTLPKPLAENEAAMAKWYRRPYLKLSSGYKRRGLRPLLSQWQRWRRAQAKRWHGSATRFRGSGRPGSDSA